MPPELRALASGEAAVPGLSPNNVRRPVLTRIRHFFREIGPRRQRRYRDAPGAEAVQAETEIGAAAAVTPQQTPAETPAPSVHGEPPGSAPAAAPPPQPAPAWDTSSTGPPAPVAPPGPEAPPAPATPEAPAASPIPEAPKEGMAPAEATEAPAEPVTAPLPETPKRRFLPRPSLPRPHLPRPSLRRPRLPRPKRPSVSLPARPRLKRPGRRALIAGGAVLLLAGGVAAVYFATDFDFGGDEEAEAPAPRIVIEQATPEEAPELGFPAFATKNTTRVAGDGPVADAAGVALATSPATGGVEGPPAVALVGEEDWPAGIAAASLVADPVGAAVLLSSPGEVPDLTLTALTALAPQGSPKTGDAQLFKVGDVTAPRGLRVRDVGGANPAELAAAVAGLRERLTGDPPEHVLLASSDRPEFAMPAAAWAARSGDPVLFVQRDSVPEPTLEALRDLADIPTYLLGPESVVSDKVIEKIADETKNPPKRVGEEDPVANAIAFARYTDGTFGWNISDPGHGLVLANTDRPADAGAAAPLSASGKWGPLLLTDSAEALPAGLEGYLLDIKPGFVDDPTRAVYNHAWLIGDDAAISVDVQAQVDELLELSEVESGRGQTEFGTLPGQDEPESVPPDDAGRP